MSGNAASRLRFAATGDSFITRRLPQGAFDSRLAALIGQAEVRLTNLEVTLHEGKAAPSALSGGTWAMARPEVLRDLLKYEFNCMTWANNHTLDYLYDGLEATARHLDAAGVVHAGAGEHLAAASAPRYLETDRGRVAIIGATSTFHDFWRAGEQRPDMKGRPGVNPLRFRTTYHVRPERLRVLREIAEATDLNAEHQLAVKEGFSTAHEGFVFGRYTFVADQEEKMTRVPHEEDMNRIIRAIREGVRQADYVIVSIHCHEMNKDRKDEAPDFLEIFARRCIDEGAHAVVGHGPHVLRGVEIYKNRPIFYSLGNFIFQNETVTALPSDFYEMYRLPPGASVADALDARSENNTKGLGVNPAVWESVVACWEMENGELAALRFYPIELGYGMKRYARGWPKLSANETILRQLASLSQKYGTMFTISGGVAEVRLNDGAGRNP